MVSIKAGKMVVLGAALGLAAATANVSALIAERQGRLETASRCPACELIDDAALELARSEGRIAAAILPGSGASAADARLHLDRLAAEIADLRRPEFASAVEALPEGRATVDGLAAALSRLGPSLDEADRHGVEALRALAPADFALSRLTAEADRYGRARAAEARADLGRLYAVSTAVLAALALAGGVLMVLLARHNRRLAVARDRLAATAGELGAASRTIAAVNGELEARNAALARRDREVSQQNKRFDAALDNMPLALCMVDAADRLVIYNRRFAALFGLDVAPIPGLLFADLVGLASGPRLGLVHARQRALLGADTESFVLELPPGLAAADAARTILVNIIKKRIKL